MSTPLISDESWSRYKKAKAQQKHGDSPVPVNFRTFLSTFTGDTSPITESSFTQEDLQFLRNVYDKKKAANLEEEGMYRDILTKYKNNPSDGLAYELVDGKLTDTTDRYIQDVRDKLAAYERTKGKTSISYNDYGGNRIDPSNGLGKQLVASFSDDPSYRVATTLGRFNVREDDKGNAYIEDTYDWTDPKADTADYFKAIPDAITSLEGAGNLIMRSLRPKTARKVRIQLPSTTSEIQNKQHNSDTLIDSGLYRSDGSLKGPGYFGELEMPNGKRLSEVSMYTEVPGYGEVEIPSVVPTLTRKELDWLLEGNNVAKKFREERHPIAVSINQKAGDWYRKRMKENKNKWWQEGEEVYPLPEYENNQ